MFPCDRNPSEHVEIDDARLVEQLLDGNPDAEAELVSAYYGDLYRFLRHLTRHAQEAEDLAQQSLIRATTHLRGFDRRSSLRTWLHRIAYREFLNWRRGRRLVLALNPMLARPDKNLECVLEGEVLLSALHRLPAASRTTFLLVEVQQMPLAEVAEVLGCPIGTVKSRLFEAKRRLREQLENTYQEARYESKALDN